MLSRRSLLASLVGITARGLAKLSKERPAIPSGKRAILVSTTWCPPCKALKSVVEELASYGQWKVGKAKDLPNIILADPESPDGWEICKVLDCITADGMVTIPRLYATRDGEKVGVCGIYRKDPNQIWRITLDDRPLTAHNLADWINEQWNRC